MFLYNVQLNIWVIHKLNYNHFNEENIVNININQSYVSKLIIVIDIRESTYTKKRRVPNGRGRCIYFPESKF